ncbi:MAG TPA: hypothetical protein VIU41_01440, partial [Geobacteraceae bacterium]
PVQAAVNQGSFVGYPSRYSDFAYKVGWQTAQDTQGVAIEGVLKNLRYGYVDSLTVAVWLVDRDGKVIARDTTFTIPQRMVSADYRTFSLKLVNATLTKGETLQFLLWTSGSEGGNGGFSWLTSFAVDATTGAVLGAKETNNPDDW